AMLLLVAMVGAWVIRAEFVRQRELARDRLQAVAELRTTQLEGWIERQMSLARFLSSGTLFPQLYRRWREQGDAQAGDQLLARAIAFREANDADSALLLDADGNTLAREHPIAHDTSAELRRAVRNALQRGQPVHTGVYRRDDGDPPLRVDIVVPLAAAVEGGARGVIVLRIDARRVLFPMLTSWPVPSTTGESVLWRHEGTEIVNVNDVRLQPDSAGRLRQPLATSALAPARVMRGELAAGRSVTAFDYRHVPVLANVRPVQGTDWWLVSKIDVDEVDAPARRNAAWAVAVAMLVLLGSGLALRLWRQRQVLVQSQRERGEQRERLRTLGLLEAITESSKDAIFAKDLQGRYVFYNRAACVEVGRTREEVLGRTDEELFGPETGARLAANDRLALAAEVPRIFEEHVPGSTGDRTNLSAKGPLFDADGERIGVFGVSRDVTEARRAERALRDSEAHYRTVVSVLTEGIVVTDPQGLVLSCNPAAERLVGTSQQGWQGRSVLAPGWRILRPDGSELPVEESPPGRVLAGAPAEIGVVLETRMPQGERRWFEVSSVPVANPDDGSLMS
ncbi:MAG: PAS domain-containing protein, partial [Ideonella sp.]|nr:PAS domain-containing protein [Ideonella sp.]